MHLNGSSLRGALLDGSLTHGKWSSSTHLGIHARGSHSGDVNDHGDDGKPGKLHNDLRKRAHFRGMECHRKNHPHRAQFRC